MAPRPPRKARPAEVKSLNPLGHTQIKDRSPLRETVRSYLIYRGISGYWSRLETRQYQSA